MCIGIPMTVTEVINEASAVCVSKGRVRTLNTLLVGKVSEGDRLLAWKDLAISRLSKEEAENIMLALEALAAVSDGKPADIEAAFPGIDRADNKENNHDCRNSRKNDSSQPSAL